MKGFKTIGFNILSAFIPLVEASGLSNYLTDSQLILYLIAIIAGNLILRVWFTSTPVGKSE